jgi:hypothetical protein
VTRNRQLRSSTPPNAVHAVGARADSARVTTDFRKIVECLHYAHYTDGEIIDYLEHFFGLTSDEAIGAVQGAGGGDVERRTS